MDSLLRLSALLSVADTVYNAAVDVDDVDSARSSESCASAKGSQELPEQVLHIAAAMLFIGFRRVVATMR
jgi:hypothetical protein